jgi:hypothetical protein
MIALPLGISPRQGILALASGLLGAGAFWPISIWPLMFVSLALFGSPSFRSIEECSESPFAMTSTPRRWRHRLSTRGQRCW